MNRRKRLHGRRRRRSAFKKGGRGWDRFQTGLSALGTFFPQADALNALVSAGRAGVAKIKGNDDAVAQHLKAAAMNTAAIIPGVGEAQKVRKAGKLLTKSIKTKPQQLAKTIKTSTPEEAIGGIGKVGSGVATGTQIKKDITGGYNKTVDKIEKKESPKITIKPKESKSRLTEQFEKGKSERKTTGLYV